MEETIKTRYVIWSIALILLAAGAWFFLRPAASSFFVDVTHPERGLALQAVYATGTVEATVMMPIAARNTARLVELNVDEGSAVKKDQILARMEDADLQKSLDELRARENFAQKDYERRAALAKRGYETKSTLDQTKSEWEASTAAVARVEAEASYMKLLAPADGRIIKRDGEIGQTISASQPVFWLSCCAPLRISAEVDEEDIAEVKMNQEVLIRADAFPGQVFHGKVQGITPKGDPVARSYRVRISLTEDTPLLIGMTAETNIIIQTHPDALLLPNSALLNNNKVWLVRDSLLVEQPVSAGARGPEKTEILSGVVEKDVVIVKPKPDMIPGQKIRAALVPQKL